MREGNIINKISIIIFAIIMMSMSSFAFTSGSGTQLDPYIVDTCADLQSLNGFITSYAKLGSDIDCSGYTYTNYHFNGHLDGNGKKIIGLDKPMFNYLQSGGEIKNLTMINGSIDYTGIDYVGAIAQRLYGNIYDVGVESYTIAGRDYVGGIAGRTENVGSIMKNVYVIDTLFTLNTGESDYIGGIIGHLQHSDRIETSYTKLGYLLDGHNFVGGIVGRNDGYIIDTYSDTDVNGNSHIGGFVGHNYGTQTTQARIIYSYSLGTATGTVNVHSFVGYYQTYNSNGVITQSYNDYETSGDNSNYGVSSLSTSELKDIRTFSGIGNWDFEKTWLIDSSINNGYPELRIFEPTYDNSNLYQFIGGDGSAGNPYQISTCEVMMKINNIDYSLSSYYELVNNIDCSESEMETIGGTFSGNFDGNNYNISGSYVELFDLNSGTIENLNVIDAELYQNTGNNVGIIAKTNTGTIQKVFTNGVVTSINDYIGGIVGINQNLGYIRESISYADIIGNTNTADYIGGIVGYNQQGGNIWETFSHNNLITGANYIGGFVGRNDGLIYYSYTHSPDIRGNTYVGGFVGYNYGSSSTTARIYSSYSTGIPTGNSNVNGFVGVQAIYSGNGLIYDAYYDKTITGDVSDYGNDVIGLTTEQFTDIRYFSGEYASQWNFDTTWYMNNITGYPALQKLDNVDNSIPSMLGDGSVGNPFQITTCRQLWKIPDNTYNNYLIINDIDCSESEMRDINNFYGTLNGGNNEISYSYIPLFNVIQTGIVKNLGILNFANMLDNQNYVGPVARQLANTGLIEDVWTSGDIDSSYSYLGGIVGHLNAGTIRDIKSYININGALGSSDYVGGTSGMINGNGKIYTSSSYGDLQGRNQVGGITGYLYQGYIYDSFSLSDKIIAENYAGGIVGYSYGSSSSYRAYLYRGYWSGTTLLSNQNSAYAGGVVGYDSGTYAYTYDSYWNQETSGITISSGGGANGLTTLQMQTQGSYAGTWDFVNLWFMDSNLNNYPNHLTTHPLIAENFNVYINYPTNLEIIELNDSTQPITFQYLHDSNSTDITCKFYLDGILYFTTYNTGNSIQEFTLSRWKDKQYVAKLSCSDSFIEQSIQQLFTVNLENDLLTGNPNTNPDGGVVDINITAILDAINSLNITSSGGGETTIIDGGTSVYHNYYTGSQYLNKDALEELNQTSIIIDPRTNETINISDKYILDMTPLFNTLTLQDDTLFANLKPKNFYDNVLTQPLLSSEEAGVENGFGAWLLDNVLLNYLVYLVIFGGVTYALSGITLGKTRWQRFYKKSFGVAVIGGVILFLINLAIKVLILA